MNDIRKKIIIIFCAVIIIVLAIVLFLFFYNKPDVTQNQPQETALPENNAQTSGEVQKIPETTVKIKPKEPSDEVYARQVAVMFVERFLSYSNQNNNTHIEDASSLATDKMADWINKQGVEWGAEYKGSVAKVVSSRIKEIDKQKASVIVDVQQSFDGKEKSTIYKSGRVDLVKDGVEWKVSGFFWE